MVFFSTHQGRFADDNVEWGSLATGFAVRNLRGPLCSYLFKQGMKNLKWDLYQSPVAFSYLRFKGSKLPVDSKIFFELRSSFSSKGFQSLAVFQSFFIAPKILNSKICLVFLFGLNSLGSKICCKILSSKNLFGFFSNFFWAPRFLWHFWNSLSV